MVTDETKILYALCAFALAIGVMLFTFLRSNIRQQRINTQLQKEKTEIEIATLEYERNRMACDLHDGVAPMLTVIKMQLEDINALSSKDKKCMMRAKKLLQEVIQRLRESSNDLVPRILEERGLLDALTEYTEDIEGTGKLNMDFKASPNDLKFEPEKEIHLYRIFQEAIHNCLQHAKASTFMIRIVKYPKYLELIIKDNGRGFNYDNMKREHFGYGLNSIGNRVELLNGSLYIDTAPGKGVKYTITLPTDVLL